MKLMTKALEKKFLKVGYNPDVTNHVVIAKYFDPSGSYTLWACEYDFVTKTFYGYVTGLYDDEFGYTSLTEMEKFRSRLGLGIERDLHFISEPLQSALDRYYGLGMKKV